MGIGNTILIEANAKLQPALKNKDFKEVSVAQAVKLLNRRSVPQTQGCSRQESNEDPLLEESKA